MTEKPVAFVIMPFDAELNEVYSAFIVPTLEEVGYVVRRADDLYSQRNILRDVVESISNSDLIVADLTGLNANVFYELGVAHGLQKSVILLTQNINELPFDLQSYRVIIYDTHFARIARATEALKQTGLRAIRGEIEFGSPVSDFASTQGRHMSRSPSAPNSSSEEEEDEEEPGWLDYRVTLEDGFAELTKILENFSEITFSHGEKTEQYTERIARASAAQGADRASSIKYIANEYARELGQYGEKLSDANDRYERVARDTQDSIEFIISHGEVSSEEDLRNLVEFVEILQGVEGAASGAMSSFLGMRKAVQSMHGVEKSMTRSARVVGREIDRFIGNIEKTVASVQRGIEIGRKKIEEIGDRFVQVDVLQPKDADQSSIDQDPKGDLSD